MGCQVSTNQLPQQPTTILPANLPQTQADWSRFIQRMQELLAIAQASGYTTGANVVPAQYSVYDGAALPALRITGATSSLDNSNVQFGLASLKLVATGSQIVLTFGASGYPITIQSVWKWIASLYCRTDQTALYGTLAVVTPSATYSDDISGGVSALTWARLYGTYDLTADSSTSCSITLTLNTTTGATFWVEGWQLEPVQGNTALPSPFILTAPPRTWTQIVDDGKKPANNADVTSQNTAADTSNVAGTPAATVVNTANQANANTPAVINPQFKNGTTGWTFDNTAGFYQETGSNSPDSACNTYLVRQGQAGGLTTAARNLGYVSVVAGQTVTALCCLKSLSANAGAYAGVRISWRDSSHTELSVTQASVTVGPGGTYLQAVSKAVGQAPANAQFAHFELYYVSHSSGYLNATSCGLSVQPASLAEVPDGGGFGKTASSRLQNGIPLIPSSGPNLIPNAGFETNLCGATRDTNVLTNGTSMCDAWVSWIGGSPGMAYASSSGYGARGGGACAMLIGPAKQYSPLAAHETRYQVGGVQLKDPPVLLPGQQIVVKWYRNWNYTSGYPIPSGVTVTVSAGVYCYNAAGTYLGEVSCTMTNAQGNSNYGGSPQVAVGTIPAATARVVVGAYLTIANGNAVATDCSWPGGTMAEIQMDDFYVGVVTDLSIDVGGTLSTQRNLPLVTWGNYGGGWSGLSIPYTTTTTSCTFTPSAATFVGGGDSIAYNASSLTVSGTAGSTVTYYLYYDDPGMTGGSKTLQATTNQITSLNANGRVLLGKVAVTYPTSGTGGGSGGTGCPQVDEPVIRRAPNGGEEVIRAGDAGVGDDLLLSSGRWGRVTYSETKQQPGVRVVGTDGSSITCSASAPLETADGPCVTAPYVRDLVLKHRTAGVMRVAEVFDVGDIWVQHITCENDCFWVGDYSHHNLKPGN
jgi:hypothetical protein